MINEDFPIFRLIASNIEIKCISQGVGSEIFNHVYHAYYCTKEQINQAKFILKYFPVWNREWKLIEDYFFSLNHFVRRS